MYYDKYVPLNLVRECLGRLQRQRAKCKIIVITNGRSGSTLLTESIGQIEGVDNFNEILHWPFIAFKPLQNYFANQTRGRYLCYKLLGYQLAQFCSKSDLWAIRSEILDPRNTIVFLERNRHSRALSKKRAFASGQWHSRSNSKKSNESVHQSIDLTERDIQQEIDNEQRLDQYFVQIGLYDRDDLIHLDYDQHLRCAEALQATIEQLCAHLNLSAPVIVPKTEKIIAG
jgi:LPS sulfotransferase NodH